MKTYHSAVGFHRRKGALYSSRIKGQTPFPQKQKHWKHQIQTQRSTLRYPQVAFALGLCDFQRFGVSAAHMFHTLRQIWFSPNPGNSCHSKESVYGCLTPKRPHLSAHNCFWLHQQFQSQGTVRSPWLPPLFETESCVAQANLQLTM